MKKKERDNALWNNNGGGGGGGDLYAFVVSVGTDENLQRRGARTTPRPSDNGQAEEERRV